MEYYLVLGISIDLNDASYENFTLCKCLKFGEPIKEYIPIDNLLDKTRDEVLSDIRNGNAEYHIATRKPNSGPINFDAITLSSVIDDEPLTCDNMDEKLNKAYG